MLLFYITGGGLTRGLKGTADSFRFRGGLNQSWGRRRPRIRICSNHMQSVLFHISRKLWARLVAIKALPYPHANTYIEYICQIFNYWTMDCIDFRLSREKIACCYKTEFVESSMLTDCVVVIV